MKLQFLLFVITVLFISSCDLIGELQEEETEYVRQSQLSIGQVSLFTEKGELFEYLGKPDSVNDGFYYYDRMNMYLAMDSVVWEVHSTNPKFKTPDGISVGDLKGNVIETYGETETWEDEDKMGETLVYWNYHFFQQTPLYLMISIKADTVNEIELWWHYE